MAHHHPHCLAAGGHDQVAEAPTVDGAVRREQVAAEALSDRARLGRLRRVQGVHQAVGIDVLGAITLRQNLANGALAAGNIAGQSEQKRQGQLWVLYNGDAPMNLKPTADNTIVLKSAREIAIMREAGQIVAAVIRALTDQSQSGMTTRDLDQIAARMFRDAGAESTALGYFGYPGHICVSVNQEVVHGIPGARK